MTLQEAASAQTIRAIPNNYSCYNTDAVAVENWNNIDLSAFGQAAKSVGGQSLRLPGGDTANYWTWGNHTFVNSAGNLEETDYGNAGGIVSWHDFSIPNSPVFNTRRPNIFPFFLPQNLPDSVRYQYTTNATIKNVKTFVTAANAEAVWEMNMNTSFLEKELAHLQQAMAKGIPISRVELGNELYFRGGFNTPSNEVGNYEREDKDDSLLPQVGGYPTPNQPANGPLTFSAYAAEAKRWADTIRAAIPGVQIAITGAADINNPSPRISNWMAELQVPIGPDGRSAMDAVDAFTIHPYYNGADLNLTKADAAIADPARAGEIARSGMSTLRSILADPGINSVGVQNKEIWVTEHNIIESDVVVLGNTWVGALMVDMHGHEFLKDSRTQLSCTHMLTGNAQWQAIVNEKGIAIDPSTRGIEDLPFVTDPDLAFSKTATGLVLGKSADVFTEGTATLLHSGDASIAWRVENTDGDAISAINATEIDELLDLPAGKLWEVLTFVGDPWATVMSDDDLEIVLDLVAGGSTITLPAFSKVIARSDASTPTIQPPASSEGVTPPRFTPPVALPIDLQLANQQGNEAESVPEPAAVLGFGIVAASLALSRRRRIEPLAPQFSKAA